MSSRVAGALSAALVVASLQAGLGAQAPVQLPVPISSVSMDDAVRLSLDRNQSLRAQRLDDRRGQGGRDHRRRSSRTSTSRSAPKAFRCSRRGRSTRASWATTSATAPASATLFERGGKRDKRTNVAQDTTEVTRHERRRRRSASCASRPSRRSSRRCSPSRRWISRRRTSRASPSSSRSTGSASQAGDLAAGRLLQDLAAEAAVRAGRLRGRSRPRAGQGDPASADGLRNRARRFRARRAIWPSTKTTVALDDLKQQALESRPDVQAAAQRRQARRRTPWRSRRATARATSSAGAGLHEDGPGESRSASGSRSTCRSTIATRATSRTPRWPSGRRRRPSSATRFSARHRRRERLRRASQTNEKIVNLYQSGYLDQARQSLEISTYVYQRGAGTTCSICSTPSARIATRSWPTGRRWPRT